MLKSVLFDCAKFYDYWAFKVFFGFEGGVLGLLSISLSEPIPAAAATDSSY
jgi:hypothetical protein